jgi:hypothetical protein
MIVELLLILVIFYLLIDSDSDGMTAEMKSICVSQIMSNKQLFTINGTLKDAKNKLPWLDPVTYEDIRHAVLSNNFNESNIINILSI